MPVVEGVFDRSDFDAVIVGSGFGGAVAAHHLAERHGEGVCVLERGKAFPPGSFPRTPAGLARNFWDPSAGLHGMFDVWSFDGIDALVSSGLGGGSLIYANVLIRKDESWFHQPHPFRPGVQERWPVTYADLDRHYGNVERFLSVQEMPFDAPGYALPKTGALRSAAASVGDPAAWHLAPLGVRFRDAEARAVPSSPLPDEAYPNLHGRPRRTCRLCGECDVGCNDGAKNTLDHTYLSAASEAGATISTRSEVRALRRTADGRFEIDVVVHHADDEGVEVDTRRLPVRTLTATELVVAAGALGSTYLLLSNRRALGITSPALGTRFCGNGDLLGFIFNATEGGRPRTLDGSLGPVITSYVRYPDQVDSGRADDHGTYIEDAGYPAFLEWLVEASQALPTTKRGLRFAWDRLVGRVLGHGDTNLSAELARVLGRGQLSASALPLLGMGRDVPDGTMFLETGDDDRTLLQSTWSTATSEAYFASVTDRMNRLADALGGDFVINPTYLLRRVITVHPLGGCPMSVHPNDGVVDARGRVHGVPGLSVCDGSILPGPVGPNPSLTIAAIADRAFADGGAG